MTHLGHLSRDIPRTVVFTRIRALSDGLNPV